MENLPVAGLIGQFATSLAAVAALVLLAHLLGFSRGGAIVSEAEAREMLRLAPGRFEPDDLARDANGGGALARDEDGRIALLFPHGGQFVARILTPACLCTQNAGVLILDDPAIGPRPVGLHLGEAAEVWAERIRSAS